MLKSSDKDLKEAIINLPHQAITKCLKCWGGGEEMKPSKEREVTKKKINEKFWIENYNNPNLKMQRMNTMSTVSGGDSRKNQKMCK